MVEYTDIYVAELMEAYHNLQSGIEEMEGVHGFRNEFERRGTANVLKDITLRQLKEAPAHLQEILQISKLEEKVNSFLYSGLK